MSTINIYVTVNYNSSYYSNVFYINGVTKQTITANIGDTINFYQSDSTNSTHPIRLSQTNNGTHSGGQEYITDVTKSGSAGSNGLLIFTPTVAGILLLLSQS